jgi:tRNA(fMet)-specific endonuclease VapC
LLVLDTDHVSILGFASHTGATLLERIGTSGQEVATTIITVEEQLRGWLAEIHRQIAGYERLQRRIDFFAAWTVLSWDTKAADLFARHRIGSLDLKIGCIVMAHGATLLTRNARDFAEVPGLRFENWLE